MDHNQQMLESKGNSLNEIKSNLDCYRYCDSLNPDLLMVFDSERRILNLSGFPCLMRESAEIVECGCLNQFRVVEMGGVLGRF